MKKQKLTAIALLVAIASTNLAYAAESVGSSNSAPIATETTRTAQKAEACDDINAAVANKAAEKINQTLPQSPNDNVQQAVVNSGAYSTNSQSSLGSLFDFDFASMSISGASIWTAISKTAEKMVEKAKEMAQKALKSAVDGAINAGIASVNRAYATQVMKIAGKLGYGGQIVTSALGGVVPSITTTVGSCAKTLDANCATHVMNAVNQSVSQGVDKATSEVGRQIDQASKRVVSDATGKISDVINDKAPAFAKNEINGVISDITRTTHEIRQDTVGQATTIFNGSSGGSGNSTGTTKPSLYK